jgi:hypothetical protein
MPSFSDSGPLYLGFDLSTQQLKGTNDTIPATARQHPC